MSKEDRWKFNKKFNSQRPSHGLIIASIDPQQHSQWIGNLRRNITMPKLIDIMQNTKGFRYVESDIMLWHKPLFNPFRFQ